MKQILFLLLITLCSCHSTTSKKGQENEADSSLLQEELYPDSIFKFKPIPTKEEQEQPSETTSFVLQPVPRDIPTGEAVSPTSLSMQTEYDYYPLSTTEVKLTVTNYSQQEYMCGNDYSLTYYNNDKRQWETLPTDPIIEDIAWILDPEYPSGEQTIKLYTSKVPNRAGKYRIYKTFNRNAQVAYAEFELVDEAGAKRLRKQMDAASWNGKTISSQNIYGSGMRGDSIFVNLINNSIHFQKLFRKEMLNYSAINYGAVRKPSPFTQRAYTDTLQISMKTEKPVYPIGTESVNVILTNKNLSQQNLFFGEYYFVARKQGEQWIPLHDNSLVHDIGIILKPDGDYHSKPNSIHCSMTILPVNIGFTRKWNLTVQIRSGIWQQNSRLNKNNSIKPLLFFRQINILTSICHAYIPVIRKQKPYTITDKTKYNLLVLSMKLLVSLKETKNSNWQNIYFPFTIFILR